jgi:hypothetical protein
MGPQVYRKKWLGAESDEQEPRQYFTGWHQTVLNSACSTTHACCGAGILRKIKKSSVPASITGMRLQRTGIAIAGCSMEKM